MATWISRGLIALSLSCAAPMAAFAQGPDVGITGLGLLSLQPVDDAYVGGPYLDAGIGGLAPGFGGAFSVITPTGFVIMAEFTTARFEQLQSGRLVPGDGGYPLGSAGITQLHDSIVAGLIGQTVGSGGTRVQFVAGVGAVLDSPTVSGKTIYGDEDDGIEEPSRFVATGGIDVLQTIASRAALVVNARYSHIGRTEQAQYLGIGPHIFRFGAGIRVRLN